MWIRSRLAFGHSTITFALSGVSCRGTAEGGRVGAADQDTRTIIGALEFERLIDEATTSALERAWERRNELVHGAAAAVGPSREEMHRVVDACREVWAARRDLSFHAEAAATISELISKPAG